MSYPELEAIRLALAAPFEAHEIKFKPQTITGNRALAVPYVDARVVMDRLDDVFGVGGWQSSVREAKDGIVCSLRVKISGEWISHEDIGGESEQPDEGDRQKAAYSDSLKRVAVRLGIGRYLYRQKPQWVDWDAQKRQFARQPVLPDSARPKAQQTAPAKPAAPSMTDANQKRADQMKRDEERLVTAGLCKEYDLRKIASKAAQVAGCGAKAESWTEAGWEAAIKAAQAFELDCDGRAPATVDQRVELDRLLIARGRVMADVVAKFGCSDPAAITSAQAEKAMELLREMPDVARETKATKTRK